MKRFSQSARACALRDRLPDNRLKRVVTCVQSIPSQPASFAQLVAELESPATSVQRLGEILSRDVGMAAKIIQLVNSGFFGSPQRVSDPAQAASLLGVDTIRALVSSTDAFSPDGVGGRQSCHLETLNTHGLAVAEAAQRIAESETEDATLIANAYLAGLLHHIGILALAGDSHEHYRDAVSTSRHEDLDVPLPARRRFHMTRDSAGAYLMELWGTPGPIVEAIAFHSYPSRSAGQVFSPLTAVHVASAVLEREWEEVLGAGPPMEMGYLRRIGCAGRLPAWRRMCRAECLEGVAS